MNITELARQVRISTPELRQILPELGFDIGLKAIQVDDRSAKKIITKLNNPRTREQFLNQNKKTTAIKLGQTGSVPQPEKTQTIKIGEKIIVKDLAAQMKLPVTRLIMELMKNGVMASLNQYIDYETATIIAEDLGFKVSQIKNDTVDLEAEKNRREKYLKDDPANLIPRPPVITIMGHVDHGKTKLLDAIRETDVVAAEAGGITQHIGAYQVEKNGQLLTFIDTPGHEAFSAMRSRGAQVADIVILVVAADDGIQPQTIESLSHIRSASLPFIVAINKIDKPEANIDKIKSALAELKLTPEDWGGQTICVEISAKAKQNIDGLLETLLLVYEMEKDNIQANPGRPAIGTIIESHLDKGEGPVATALVQTGTLKKSDTVKIGSVFGKIRIMKDWHSHSLTSAPPSMPVKIIGLKSVPEVGEILQVVTASKIIKKEMRQKKEFKTIKNIKHFQSAPQNQEEKSEIKIKKLNIILKTDVLGSQEAIIESLESLQQPDLIINPLHCGLGNITEVDVEQALKEDALIIGFNVKTTSGAELLARDKNIDLKTSKIIYELLDYLKEKMNTLIEPDIKTTNLGQLQVIKIFRTNKNSQIIGGKVLTGKITASAKLNIFRNENLIGQATLTRLQSAKQNVSEVLADQEAGLEISDFSKIQEGDIIEAYSEETIKRKI